MTEPVIHVSIEPVLADFEAASRFLGGISERKLKELVFDGELAARKLGGRTMFEIEELRRFASSLPSWKPKA